MMIFDCKLCSYSTMDSSNYNKHRKTLAHKKKCDKTQESSYDNANNILDTTDIYERNQQPTMGESLKCLFCNVYFSRKSSLSRHQQYCLKKPSMTAKYEREITELKNKYEREILTVTC